MQRVMLKRNWPASPFHRTLKDEAGQGVLYSFYTGMPVELSDDQVEELRERGDLGLALELATLDEKGRARPAKSLDELVPTAQERYEAGTDMGAEFQEVSANAPAADGAPQTKPGKMSKAARKAEARKRAEAAKKAEADAPEPEAAAVPSDDAPLGDFAGE